MTQIKSTVLLNPEMKKAFLDRNHECHDEVVKAVHEEREEACNHGVIDFSDEDKNMGTVSAVKID